MLVAPAGYGKSTILADWTEQDERPSAWLTLDERHNDPALLLGAIASLLDEIEPIGDEVFAPIATPRSGVSSVVVPRLRDALEGRRQPFILVLDDLHLVENPDCLDPLVEIAQSIPAGSQIAFASRTEPKLPLGRMRADRLLTEIDARDLEMNAGRGSADARRVRARASARRREATGRAHRGLAGGALPGGPLADPEVQSRGRDRRLSR